MTTVHMVLQGKGGVGKSFVAATMAQYLRDKGREPVCIDTDPVNKTFAGYESLGVQTIELMDGDEIDPRRFDGLIETIFEGDADQHFVVDNGASSFVPLCGYLLSCGVPAMLAEASHTLVLHSVVTGGQGQSDTLEGLHSLLTRFPGVPCVVWLNPVHGKIEHEGKPFTDFKVFRENQQRIAALIEIPTVNPRTTGHDLSELLKSRRTFREADENASLPIMCRQRLSQVRKALYQSLDASQML